jgi:hypothetical protein
MKQARATMRRIGVELIEERMREATAEKLGMGSSSYREERGTMGEEGFGKPTTRKDLLSVLGPFHPSLHFQVMIS